MAILLDGIVLGLQLSMLAVGLTLVYGLAGILNLAHGQLVVVAALLAALLLSAGVPVAVALSAAVAAGALGGWLLATTLLRRVLRLDPGQRTLPGLLLTLALAFALDGLFVTTQPLTRFSLAVGRPSLVVLGVSMRTSSVLAAGVSALVLVGLTVVLRGTRTGRAVRAHAQDEEGAVLCGVDPSRTRTLVFVLSGGLAGTVAITQGLVASVGATSGFELTVLALIVTVVGGLGRIPGALLAGVLLGVVHTLAAFAFGPLVTSVVLLAAAVATILLRPSGLLGSAP